VIKMTDKIVGEWWWDASIGAWRHTLSPSRVAYTGHDSPPLSAEQMREGLRFNHGLSPVDAAADVLSQLSNDARAEVLARFAPRVFVRVSFPDDEARFASRISRVTVTSTPPEFDDELEYMIEAIVGKPVEFDGNGSPVSPDDVLCKFCRDLIHQQSDAQPDRRWFDSSGDPLCWANRGELHEHAPIEGTDRHV
jgi:hypothetical protein